MRRENEAAGAADAVAWVFGGMKSSSVGYRKEFFWTPITTTQAGGTPGTQLKPRHDSRLYSGRGAVRPLLPQVPGADGRRGDRPVSTASAAGEEAGSRNDRTAHRRAAVSLQEDAEAARSGLRRSAVAQEAEEAAGDPESGRSHAADRGRTQPVVPDVTDRAVRHGPAPV